MKNVSVVSQPRPVDIAIGFLPFDDRSCAMNASASAGCHSQGQAFVNSPAGAPARPAA